MRRISSIILIAWAALIFGCSDSDDDVSAPEISFIPDTVRVPADVATIQAAIDSADTGDIVLVADGIYTGEGNRDIDFGGKSVRLVSEHGPEVTIIDCNADSADQHFGIKLEHREDSTVIDGFTIRSAFTNQGAGISFRSSSPVIRNCVIAGNHATVSGGGVRCKSSSPHFINCTLVGNAADMVGGGLQVIAGSTPVFDNCIIAFSTSGAAVFSSDATSIPVFTCCDIFGNAGGDWTGVIADQMGERGNFSLDPLFCDAAENDFRLQPASPCAPANNSCDSLIGALDTGCQ